MSIATNYTAAKENLVKYYQNLLERQYHDKPKARAEIRLMVELFLANMTLWQVGELNLNIDEANGYTADIIGLWAGLNRYFALNRYDRFKPYYAYVNWDNAPIVQQGGLSNWFIPRETDYPFFKYGDFEIIFDKLNVFDFIRLLKLKIIINNTSLTMKNIDNAIYKIFGQDLITEWGDMWLKYKYSNNLGDIISFATDKNLLPHPCGVTVYVEQQILN